MYTQTDIRLSAEQKKSTAEVLGAIRSALAPGPGPGPMFVIGSWQTGDFGHVYAAMVAHLGVAASMPIDLLVVEAEGAGTAMLRRDIEFALKAVCQRVGGTVGVWITSAIEKSRAINVMRELMKLDCAREPWDATFWAEESVKRMTQGQPLTPVWAEFTRGMSEEYLADYEAVCLSFMDEYIRRFGRASGRENFVCLWGRTSGAPTPTRKLGGANPQYDSSELGNHQLCVTIKKMNPRIKAIFTVGDGFAAETKRLDWVLDLGDFWKKMKTVKGRFQENGFFDYMTAFYDCNVVHVGMKSGGMDCLGLWGQKVVFIDSIRSPEITKTRVAAWSTQSILPVAVSAMPTPLGKAIETARESNPNAFKTTFSSAKQVGEMTAAAQSQPDGFADPDLEKIARAVGQMLG